MTIQTKKALSELEEGLFYWDYLILVNVQYTLPNVRSYAEFQPPTGQVNRAGCRDKG